MFGILELRNLLVREAEHFHDLPLCLSLPGLLRDLCLLALVLSGVGISGLRDGGLDHSVGDSLGVLCWATY